MLYLHQVDASGQISVPGAASGVAGKEKVILKTLQIRKLHKCLIRITRLHSLIFSGLESQRPQVEGIQAGENQRVRSSDEDQT
jgi:hypothetical protein